MNKQEKKKEYLGYELTDKGIKLTNERIFEGIPSFILDPMITKQYNKYKKWRTYSKAVKIFNNLYSNELLINSYQEVLREHLNNPKYDITLVFWDTSLLYDILKNNKEIVKKKKEIKLNTDELTPKTEFLEKCSYVETALRNRDLVDTKTQKQVIALVGQTITEARNIENLEYIKTP